MLEAAGVIKHDGERAVEEAVVTVDADAAKQNLFFLADDVGNVVDDTDVVVANDAKGDGVLAAALASPFRLDNSVAEALAKLRGIGAVLPVNLDAAATCDEAKDLVAIDGLAASCHLEIETFQVLVNDKDISPFTI